MRPLKYSINTTVDGCCHHEAGVPDEELHLYHAANVARTDAMILGRVTYQLMEYWRTPDGEEPSPEPFAVAINAARKYVVSSTLESVDWNSELLRGDPVEAVRALKEQPGRELSVGGVTLPLALADAGLIDEYEFIVLPRIAGHGPWLFAGLAQYVDLELVERKEFTSGALALTYVPRT